MPEPPVIPPLQGLRVKVDADKPGLGPELFPRHEEGAALEDARLDERPPGPEDLPRQLGINAKVVVVRVRPVRGFFPRYSKCIRDR